MVLKFKLQKKFYRFLLIYFVFFTLSFTLITFAKYIGVVRGNGVATIAKWEVLVDDTSSNHTLNVVSGNTNQDYTLRVTSTSEVGVSYQIILSNVPNSVNVSIDGGSGIAPTNGTITFNGASQVIDANATTKTKEHVITFSSLLGSTVVNNNQVRIDVVFTQVAA